MEEQYMFQPYLLLVFLTSVSVIEFFAPLQIVEEASGVQALYTGPSVVTACSVHVAK